MAGEDETPVEGENDVWEMQVDPGNIKHPLNPPSPPHSKGDKPIKSVGDLYDALGNPGRMAIIMFVLLALNFMSVTTNHVVGVFFSHIPEHECHPDLRGPNATGMPTQSGFRDTSAYRLASTVNQTAAASPLTVTSHDACSVTISNASDGTNFTRECRPGEWRYQISGAESSSVTEWDLVCEYTYLANLANTFYFIGVTVGGFTVAYISDTLGRKLAIHLCLYGVITVGLGIFFSQSFVLFLGLRTLMGIAAQALMTTSYIQIVEMFPSAHRGSAGAGAQCFWGMSNIYLSLMAWTLKDWRHIQLACTVPAMFACIYLLWMPESPRWLLSRGKTTKAAKVVKRIYRFNRATNEKCLEPDLMVKLTTGHRKEKQTFMALCRSPTLRRNTIIFAHVSCALNLGYWGITYNLSKLVGNRYLNFLLGAVGEMTILTANIYIVNRFGRKRPMVVYFIIGAVCCAALAFIHQESHKALCTAIATLGRLVNAGLFSAGDLYAAEMFPTSIRTTGVSLCVLTGRLGGMLAPQIFTLGEFTFPELPLLIFSCTSLTGAVLSCLLPETSSIDLSDTVIEAEVAVLARQKMTNKDNGHHDSISLLAARQFSIESNQDQDDKLV